MIHGITRVSKNVMRILKSEQVSRRLLSISAIIVATLTAVGIWLAFSLLRPTPPRTVIMAVDPEGSFDAEVGKRYREIFARDGIDLRLVPSIGAVDSIARLQDPKSGISIAIIPVGIANREESPRLVTLGTLFYEPLWLFSHNQHLETHEQLRNLRISIGPEGSASHKLALEFLARVGVFEQRSATLLSFTPQESSAKLLNGDIDAAVFMGAWQTPIVRQLLVAQNIDLVPIRRADAFVALYPFLNKLILPAGVANLEENRPPTDVTLIGVEGEGGYFRRNHLVPVPQVASWEELNVLLLEASKKDEQPMIGERTQTVGAGMHTEREHLRTLAEEGFDLAAVHFPHVNTSGCVRVLTNFYSVPLPVGVEVQVKVYSTYVEIWYQGQRLARHERCFDRHQKVLNLEHYLEALTKKPGALAGSTPLEQWRAQGRWPVSFDRYWEMLKQRQGRQSGTRAMIDVLLLGRQYGYPSLKIAIEKALETSCFDVDVVRLLLDAERLGRREAEPVEIGALRCYDRPQPTTRNYDQLLRNYSATGVIQ